MIVSLRITSLLCFLCIILGSGQTQLQAKPSITYIRPAETKEVFQLEKIPLTVHSMKVLSKHLVILACRDQANTPTQQRASGQLLALAMMLDPTNQEARATDKQLSRGHHPQASDATQLARAQSKLRFYKRWLANPEAGPDANRLASYLTDASRILAPNNSLTEDIADWTGILPLLKEYPKAHQDIKPSPPKKNIPVVPDDKLKPPPEANTSSFHITALNTTAALITQNSVKLRYNPQTKNDIYHTVSSASLTPVKLQIELPDPSLPSKPPTLKFTFNPPIPRPAPYQESEPNTPSTAQKINATLTNLIKTRHGTLPSGSVQIKTVKGSYSLSNELAITGPVALMLESSLTNQPIRTDIVICAEINSQGKLLQSKHFWETIGILRKSETGGKLIIPSGSAELVTQILVFDEPDFFTRWEVFTAEDLDQAMDIAAQETDDHVTQASELFASIQKLADNSAVTKLAVNRAVRKRLADIQKLCPSHFSATALLIQGGGKRPIRLSKEALAHELLPVFTTIHEQIYSGIETRPPTSESLKQTHVKLRQSIDPLERILDRSNDDLYQKTIKLTNDFRRLISLSRRISTHPEDNSKSYQSFAAIVFSMQGECDSLIEQIEQTITSPK